MIASVVRGVGVFVDEAPLHEFTTNVAPSTSEPSWDEDHSVELDDITPDDFANLSLNFKVYDSRSSLFLNVDERLVGVHSFDLLEIYRMPRHAALYTWVGLTRRAGDSTLTGRLRVSVVVIGPGDVVDLSIFDERDGNRYEALVGETRGVEAKLVNLARREGKVRVPPAVERSRSLYFLQVSPPPKRDGLLFPHNHRPNESKQSRGAALAPSTRDAHWRHAELLHANNARTGKRPSTSATSRSRRVPSQGATACPVRATSCPSSSGGSRCLPRRSRPRTLPKGNCGTPFSTNNSGSLSSSLLLRRREKRSAAIAAAWVGDAAASSAVAAAA